MRLRSDNKTGGKQVVVFEASRTDQVGRSRLSISDPFSSCLVKSLDIDRPTPGPGTSPHAKLQLAPANDESKVPAQGKRMTAEAQEQPMRWKGKGRYKLRNSMRRLDGRLRRHKRMIVSCFEKGAALFLNMYLAGLKPPTCQVELQTTDSRLALQSVTSQQLTTLAARVCALCTIRVPLCNFPAMCPKSWDIDI
jgi:hypothetical protein